MSIEITADELLVERSLAGDRSAFGAIVARYQSLVAAIAYSNSGSLSVSEDLAQETFLEAWRRLASLRDRTRLRPWLCRIAQHRSIDAARRDGREPLRAAEPIETAADAPTLSPPPAELAISAEEEALLWHAVGRIPETYRTPLVLFYREQQSIADVAASMGLSEDLVRQRLSRGRNLLRDQLQAFVEGALQRSAPGAAFTAAVLAALPLAAPSTATAMAMATAAKGGSLAKSALLATIASVLIGPIVAFAGSYFSVRAGLDAARTPRERATLLGQTREFAIASVVYSIVATVYLASAPGWLAHATAYASLGMLLPLGFAGWLVPRIVRAVRESRLVRAQERVREPTLFDAARERVAGRRSEYRSRLMLLGLPLLHVRYEPPSPDAAPARGWIAIGDVAEGVLFALGGVARGGIAVGGVAIGVLAVGGVAVGPLALGGVAFGVLALGGAAFGLTAIGGFATGWRAAFGALALSYGYAGGGLAVGEHANDAAVREHFATVLPDPSVPALFALLVLLCVVPGALYAWRVRVNLRPH
jgi:RNA polymerase sigma factor (sigma-70 family)